MGHQITAIILKGAYHHDKVVEFDLQPVPLTQGLTLFHIDHYYTACWQHKLQTKGLITTYNIGSCIFPCEQVIYEIVKQVSADTETHWAIIQTDYFGGEGTQDANAFINDTNVSQQIYSINKALQALGVTAAKGYDEFDTVGLYNIRRQPTYLDKYTELADELGV